MSYVERFFFTKKWLTSLVERENQPNEFKPNVLEKTTMFAYNNQKLLVRPCPSGKTSLTLKIFSRIPNRDIYLKSKSPPEQYSNSKNKVREIGEEIKPLSEYGKAIIVLADILGTSKNKHKDQCFIRGRHENLEFFYLS